MRDTIPASVTTPDASACEHGSPAMTTNMPSPPPTTCETAATVRLDDDSEATEDEFAAVDDRSQSPSSTPPKRKKPAGIRALKQLLADPHAKPSAPLARHDAAFKAAIRRGYETGERPKRRSTPTPRFAVPSARMPTLHVERDTAIMQLVLEKRPYLIHRENRERELLALIVRALKPNRVWAMTTQAVDSQIKFLRQVMLEEDHVDHATLIAAKELSGLVNEYLTISDTDLENVLQKINASATPGGPSIVFDDVLLLEVIQRRVLTLGKKPKLVNAAWDELTSALNKRLGVKVFYSGSSCKNRVARLRAVARGTRQDPLIKLSEPQQKMLDELEDIASCAMKRRQSDASTGDGKDEPHEINYQSLASDEESSGDEQARVSKRMRHHGPHVLFADGGREIKQPPANKNASYRRLCATGVDVLLTETIRLRPLGRDDQQTWDAVAACVNRRIDGVVFTSGLECFHRINLLRRARGKPVPPDFIHLATEQRELLSKIDWLDQKEGLPSDSVALEQDGVVRKPIPDGEDTPPQSVKQPGHLDVKPDAQRSVRPGSMERVEKKIEQLEAILAHERREAMSEKLIMQQRIMGLEQTVRVLQARAHDSDTTSSMWAQRLDQERQQHHTQLEKLMNMLQAERTAQRQETRAMLDAIAAERREFLHAVTNARPTGPSSSSSSTGPAPRHERHEISQHW